MSLFDWLFGKPKAIQTPPAPIVTIGVSSEEWTEWMLDEIEERELLKKRLGRRLTP